MISWDIDATGQHLWLKQRFARPVVYLDHWAIRKLAASASLATRFSAAIHSLGATWAISMLNLMEFIEMTDEGQAIQFEELIDLVLPNIFFIEFQPFTVIDNERALIEGKTRSAPYGDASLLDAFKNLHPDNLRGFAAKGLVREVIRQRDRLHQGLESFRKVIVERVGTMQDQMRADDKLEHRVRGSQACAIAQPTWLYTREFVGTLLLSGKKMTQNDAMDLMHSVVPVTYCNMVLLDSGWAHRVGVISRRFVKYGIPFTPAEVFTGKTGELERFLQRLEASAMTRKAKNGRV